MAEAETATSHAPGARGRGGRQARQAQRVGRQAPRIIAGVRRQIPTYDLLSEEGCAKWCSIDR